MKPGWLARLLPPSWRRLPPRIPDALWHATLADYPFLAWRSPEDVQALRSMAESFLATKEFHGAEGFAVTDEVAVAVAAQACLPVLKLGLSWYGGFVGIVMHEGPVLARREWTDESGLVHTWQEELVGEAVEGGPVMLSWQQGAAWRAGGLGEAADPKLDGTPDSEGAFNVVVHEFVHLLDLSDGVLDGIPALPAEARQHWQGVLLESFDRFDERSACGYDSVVDAYGAQDPVEFFAVTSEAFFTRPRALRSEMPALYECYRSFYRQDPQAGSAEG